MENTRFTGKIRRLVVALAVVGVATTVASGCSIEMTSSDAPESTQASSPASTTASSPATTADSDSSLESDSPTASAAGSVRDEYGDRITSKRACTSGVTEISTPGTAIELTGTCDEVKISAAGIIVFVNAATTLTITAEGVGTIADVTSVDTIVVESTGCLVQWHEGDPTVQDHGSANVIEQAA